MKEKIVTFQNRIKDEANFEEIQSIDIYESSQIDKTGFLKTNEKNRYTHSFNFQKKYWQYPIKFLALTSIVIGLMLAKFFVIENSAYDLSYIVSQLFFSDRVIPRIRLASVLIQDVLSDNTTTIRNLPILKQYPKEIYFLQNATHNLTESLRNRDNTYDPVIEGILTGDACSYSTSSYANSFCPRLRQELHNAGLIKFMTNYYTALEDYLNQYIASNKSKETIVAIGADTFYPIFVPMVIMTDLMSIISNRLDNIFYNTKTKGSINNNLTSGFLFAALVVIGLLIHIKVINRVREAENEFKNVLKAFPAKLILSNFILRSYLTRTWKGMSNSSKLLNG